MQIIVNLREKRTIGVKEDQTETETREDRETHMAQADPADPAVQVAQVDPADPADPVAQEGTTDARE